jgi:hypothetical protein
MFEYDWCGIGIRSAIELPLIPGAGAPADPVTVTAAAVPDHIDAPQAIFPLFMARPGRLLLNIPQVARFLVEEGQRITFEAYPEAEPHDIHTFLLGSGLGAICHQRGLLPLHASAVRVGDGCVAFGGASGAGKSTIATFLAARGHPLIADDQTVVALGADGTPVVRQGPGRVKLWKDGLDQLSTDASGLSRVRGRLDKYQLQVATDAGAEPLPLRRLYLLADGGSGLRIDRLTGFEALEAVRQNVYRRLFAPPLGMVAHSFRMCTAVASSAEVAVLTRPRGFDRLAGLLEELEAEWSLKSA